VVLRGEAQIESFCLGYVISGSSGNWEITVTERGHLPLERTTFDKSPFALLTEMLDSTVESCRRAFQTAPPQRVATKTPIRRAR
jgi:hypothetical protein